MDEFYKLNDAQKEVTVCGIPFNVSVEDGMVTSLPYDSNYHAKESKEKIIVNKECEAIFFLGMTTRSFQCSEWWGQQEALYDHSPRLFLGDRVGRINIVYTDESEELISLLFGVNVWNYDLFEEGKPWEKNLMPFGAPFREPFESDAKAGKLFKNSLHLMENTNDDAEKCTKWVMGVRVNPEKCVKMIFFVPAGKSAEFNISGITALKAGAEINKDWRLIDLDFFLRKEYYKDVYKLSHRLYQYKKDLPESIKPLQIEGYNAPLVTFSGDKYADIYTNVYRKNIMDMAYNKVDDTGRTHTSTPNTLDFGCYIGMGTFKRSGNAYSDHIWTRDIGRLLIELVHAGYFERVETAIDDLHTFLYADSDVFKMPHWKRIANHNFDSIQGKENDGHASIMLGIYALYNKGYIDKEWAIAHKKELFDAANWFVWQVENPKESSFDRVLHSNSEASTQGFGGYDLFSNILSREALLSYAKIFDDMEDKQNADKFRETAEILYKGCLDRFIMQHPEFGNVFTDTTDDCWTWEYKRFAEAFIKADTTAYDIAREKPELFEIMNRTFKAQKEQYYDPHAGRQMGYGQGYLTQSVLMLDHNDEFTDCVKCAAMFCYHHTDEPYIVPEGVIVHGSKEFWFRNSDLGNAVQQAETIKNARLIIGIDDTSDKLKFVPRIPNTWNEIRVLNYPVKTDRVDFSYVREGNGYRLKFKSDKPVDIAYARVGPFDRDIAGKEMTEINGRKYVYLEINKKLDNLDVYIG